MSEGFRKTEVPSAEGRPSRRPVRSLVLGLVILLAMTSGVGCVPLRSTRDLQTADRWARGYVIVLPGIEGRSYLNESIAFGLNDGGVSGAIEIYDWTVGGSLTWLLSLRWSGHHQKETAKIVAKIKSYQDTYPGRPVCLIGHSGGGGIAVMVLENLPLERKINCAILLAPALAPDHDLRRGLTRTRSGIWNYYSKYDVGFLQAGTATFGTMDGRHGRAAGAVGFDKPWGMDKSGHDLYDRMLHEQEFTPQMAQAGHYGLHTTWARQAFVARWLAPIIKSSYAPVPEALSHTAPGR